jgi:hypothetical protein
MNHVPSNVKLFLLGYCLGRVTGRLAEDLLPALQFVALAQQRRRRGHNRTLPENFIHTQVYSVQLSLFVSMY